MKVQIQKDPYIQDSFLHSSPSLFCLICENTYHQSDVILRSENGSEEASYGTILVDEKLTDKNTLRVSTYSCLQHGNVYIVEVASPSKITNVVLQACSTEDYQTLSQNSQILMDHKILSQVRVCNVGHPFHIWLYGNVIELQVKSISPNSDSGCLSQGTIFEVVPPAAVSYKRTSLYRIQAYPSEASTSEISFIDLSMLSLEFKQLSGMWWFEVTVRTGNSTVTFPARAIDLPNSEYIYLHENIRNLNGISRHSWVELVDIRVGGKRKMQDDAVDIFTKYSSSPLLEHLKRLFDCVCGSIIEGRIQSGKSSILREIYSLESRNFIIFLRIVVPICIHDLAEGVRSAQDNCKMIYDSAWRFGPCLMIIDHAETVFSSFGESMSSPYFTDQLAGTYLRVFKDLYCMGIPVLLVANDGFNLHHAVRSSFLFINRFSFDSIRASPVVTPSF